MCVDKNELMTFKNAVRNDLICLRRLHFVLFLPIETKLDEIDLYWFDLNHRAVEYEINEVMLLYTVPYLLNSQQQLCNHTFGRRSTVNEKIDHMKWAINCDPSSINASLAHLQHVNSLEFFYDIKVGYQRCSLLIISLNETV